MDRLFGDMRQAGLSASRLNQAKSLYTPFFRWAKRRGMTSRDPMVDFEMPTSTYLSKERTPPEIEELSLLLSTAVEVVPDIAPAARPRDRSPVCAEASWSRYADPGSPGTRTGSPWTRPSASPDRSRRPRRATSEPSTSTKKRSRCCDGNANAPTNELWSTESSCARTRSSSVSPPIARNPCHLTTSRSVSGCSRGTSVSRPSDQTSWPSRTKHFASVANLPLPAQQERRARPQMVACPSGKSERASVAANAGRHSPSKPPSVESKPGRPAAATLDFDGSIVALRKFTSSELLDAGFNLSMVAQRQGHGPQVLTRHYSKSRASADKRAAEHLGRVVHGGR